MQERIFLARSSSGSGVPFGLPPRALALVGRGEQVRRRPLQLLHVALELAEAGGRRHGVDAAGGLERGLGLLLGLLGLVRIELGLEALEALGLRLGSVALVLKLGDVALVLVRVHRAAGGRCGLRRGFGRRGSVRRCWLRRGVCCRGNVRRWICGGGILLCHVFQPFSGVCLPRFSARFGTRLPLGQAIWGRCRRPSRWMGVSGMCRQEVPGKRKAPPWRGRGRGAVTLAVITVGCGYADANARSRNSSHGARL